MAVLIHAVIPGVTTDQYDALNARLQETPEIFAGCLSHVCVPTGEGLEVFDVWASEQQMMAFADKMMPLAVEEGWPAGPGQPEILPVHNYWVPGA
ncbi:hypothetical protein F4556_007314 [Kitasatospora gansuensis]|uniref:ABM domain-containing protein n=1 Tax=Kitasatospora gansuensis TaxID=258050 RepID=A0A7W7WMG8_9ACTN|nr:hypothetical protein [Kitasatospora gansuensis]MBB4951779.1 hypothetical protein [Kitasatospora gansuensis]